MHIVTHSGIFHLMKHKCYNYWNFVLSLPLFLKTTTFYVSKSFAILEISCKWLHAVFIFCDWLLLLRIISSMFISVAAHERISSLFKCWIIFHFLPFNPPPYSSIYHLSMTNFLYPFIHQWTLWMLYLLAIVNNAAINMRVQISLQDTTFNCFDKYSELGCWIML